MAPMASRTHWHFTSNVVTAGEAPASRSPGQWGGSLLIEAVRCEKRQVGPFDTSRKHAPTTMESSVRLRLAPLSSGLAAWD
jgi:hypothetical protein